MKYFYFSVIRRNAHDCHGPAPVQSTLNDLPQPQGSWKTNYDAKQKSYNMQLAFGIGFLIASIVFGQQTGLLKSYDDYPEKPATIDSYK